MKRKKQVQMIIEASSTGFGIYGEDFPYTAYGDSIPAAKKDLESVVSDMLEHYEKEKQTAPAVLNDGNIEFVYRYDIGSIFEHFGVLDATNLARRIGMNPSLLRQYKTGKALASDKQKKKIEEGLHALGRELLSVRL